MVTINQLYNIMPNGKKRIDPFVEPLNEALREFNISTPARQAAFIAQIAHESGEFKYVRELASGAAYDTGRLAARLGNSPQADGDGQKYKGRGLIQITGRSNYIACSKALGLDLINKPELLEQPINAARSAAWFWSVHGLNELADAGDFITITKRINGGTNGLADRKSYWARAKKFIFQL